MKFDVEDAVCASNRMATPIRNTRISGCDVCRAVTGGRHMPSPRTDTGSLLAAARNTSVNVARLAGAAHARMRPPASCVIASQVTRPAPRFGPSS